MNTDLLKSTVCLVNIIFLIFDLRRTDSSSSIRGWGHFFRQFKSSERRSALNLDAAGSRMNMHRVFF